MKKSKKQKIYPVRKINQTEKGTLVRKLEVLYNRERKGDEDYEKPY